MPEEDQSASTTTRRKKRGLGRLRRSGHRTPDNLHTLIRVFAGFSKVDGAIQHEDVDSALGFLRYDYTRTIYSELQEIYRKALRQSQDLNQMAQELAGKLSQEEKILLGVQLYVLISRSSGQRDQLVSFYLFMTNLGIASEAIDIVYQLNAEHIPGDEPQTEIPSRLEALNIGQDEAETDLRLGNMSPDSGLSVFRFQDLILIKNTGTHPLTARGRVVSPGDFCRIYPNQRVILDETVLTYTDLVFYLNAKKDVSANALFASVIDGPPKALRIERRSTKQSELELRFGLGTEIRALRDTTVKIAGKSLEKGESFDAREDDVIELAGGSSISLMDLRRRAREFGGQFELELNRTSYQVSNNPDLLEPGDILLSRGLRGEILLEIDCDYINKSGTLRVIQSNRPISIDDVPVKGEAELSDGDSISLGQGQFLLCDFTEGIIQEQRTLIRTLELDEIHHQFGRDVVLDGISLRAKRGDLICVMGPSGCGKSTLLRTLGGQLEPSRGTVALNGSSLYEHLESHAPYIAFTPQDDTYDPLLKVHENISAAAAIRCPHLPLEERHKRSEAKLVELGLFEQRNRLAGDAETKLLSGGERKRLNVGLDMIAIADVYLFDEPTSGLSSKDSEHVLEIIRGLSHNKIVLVSIHQPSARLFRMFDQALLLDRGGKMVHYGPPDDMLDYFTAAVHEEHERNPSANLETDVDGGRYKVTQPEEIFDVLETPLRDPGGDILFERDQRGHHVPARRYTPEFWRDRFLAQRLMNEVDQPAEASVAPDEEADGAVGLLKPPARTWRDELVILWTLLRRSFLSKLRSRGNLATTLLAAPGLALLIATVSRYSEEDNYTMASAFHIPTYLFLTLIVAMFLGLTNSADDVIRDRATLVRERNHRVRCSFYIGSKVATLGVFALVQCAIYLWIGNAILEIRQMFGIYLLWMFLTALVGVCLGLLVSSIVRDPKTALNAIPVILIPQIILGGALIKYDEMNHNLDLVYSVQKWTKKDQEGQESPSNLRVPFICQFMPLRWSYEALVVSQNQLNPRSRAVEELYAIKDRLSEIAIDDRTEEEASLLRDCLQVLIKVNSLSAPNASEVDDKLAELMGALENGDFDESDDRWYYDGKDAVTAEELYVNQKVYDLVEKANMERNDYRKASPPNVFLATKKRILGITVNTVWLDLIVVLLFLALTISILHLTLSRQLDRV